MFFENVEVAGVANAIRGMRNPMMSHDKSDTREKQMDYTMDDRVAVGPNDAELAMRLIRGGSPHRKFLRQIFVSVDICQMPLYMLIEFDTYQVGTTKDSSSTMHKIMSRPISENDFEEPETALGKAMLRDTVEGLNVCRDNYLLDKGDGKKLNAEEEFRDMKRMLPASYLYERITWTANYEVLANIWKWRHAHRLPVWHVFCTQFIEKLPHAEWILEAAKS